MILEKIIILIAIFISYFLQTSLEFFQLGGIKPDFLLLLTIYYSMNKGEMHGIWIGFIAGLLQDINLGVMTIAGTSQVRHYLGINILPKALVGYLGGKFSSSIQKYNNFSWFVIVFIFSLTKGVVLFILTGIFHGNVAAEMLVTVILPESLYNALLSLLWFRLLYWIIPPMTTQARDFR
ncbi:MAG: rod shape-determining protein MreD [Spirochaetia bacterium]|nr:rod shape-determining protein MreD [Spirochaetia bacterium]